MSSGAIPIRSAFARRPRRDPEVFWALGLMSGTSMDGIDVALIETDGADHVVAGPTHFEPFFESVRLLVREAAAAFRSDPQPGTREAFAVRRAENAVASAYARAIERFFGVTDIRRDEIDVVGLHGQTLIHAPERGLTVQIAGAFLVANQVKLPIVHDFRTADVSSGGEGAPLAPAFHEALTAAAGLRPPVAFLNLGGVANVTYVGPDRAVLAFDTGPANALLDDLMDERAGRPFDAGGEIAAAGRVNAAALGQFLAHPFFDRAPPKSLDRNDFDPAPIAGLSVEDAAATLVAFSAEAIARALRHLPEQPDHLILAGGGVRNPTLVRAIEEATGRPALSLDALGWSADFLEAQAFAYLAVRHVIGAPISFPGTTGVKRPLTGGTLVKPRTVPARGHVAGRPSF